LEVDEGMIKLNKVLNESEDQYFKIVLGLQISVFLFLLLVILLLFIRQRKVIEDK
jgi:hypothetical protein